MNLREQADFLMVLRDRTVMSDGAIAGESYMLVTKADAQELHSLAQRLLRMAPHEAAIARMVLGR